MANLLEEDVIFDPEAQLRLIRLVKQNISDFFAPKQYFCGGSIPHTLLYSQESVDLVLKTPFNQGVHYCQEVIVPQLPKPEKEIVSGVDWDIFLMLELIQDAKTAKVPIDYQAGLILLYFKFCRGCSMVDLNQFLDWAEYNSCAA